MWKHVNGKSIQECLGQPAPTAGTKNAILAAVPSPLPRCLHSNPTNKNMLTTSTCSNTFNSPQTVTLTSNNLSATSISTQFHTPSSPQKRDTGIAANATPTSTLQTMAIIALNVSMSGADMVAISMNDEKLWPKTHLRNVDEL